jgi:hypothetical protein
MNGAQTAAFGTYAVLTWLGRKAEMAAASWLKNALEDTSSGEWIRGWAVGERHHGQCSGLRRCSAVEWVVGHTVTWL